MNRSQRKIKWFDTYSRKWWHWVPWLSRASPEDTSPSISLLVQVPLEDVYRRHKRKRYSNCPDLALATNPLSVRRFRDDRCLGKEGYCNRECDCCSLSKLQQIAIVRERERDCRLRSLYLWNVLCEVRRTGPCRQSWVGLSVAEGTTIQWLSRQCSGIAYSETHGIAWKRRKWYSETTPDFCNVTAWA